MPPPHLARLTHADGVGNRLDLADNRLGVGRDARHCPTMPTSKTLLIIDDDDDLPLPLPRQLDPAMQRTARLASLDPNDGIEL